MSLKNRIAALAEEFSVGILAAIRSASLEEILVEGGHASAARRTTSASPASPKNGAAAAAPKAGGAAASEKPAKRRGGRLPRRSPEQIAAVVESLVVALRKNKNGMRSEQLQKLLSLDKKEISGPLAEALSGKKITKKGQRRATTYFVR